MMVKQVKITDLDIPDKMSGVLADFCFCDFCCKNYILGRSR